MADRTNTVPVWTFLAGRVTLILRGVRWRFLAFNIIFWHVNLDVDKIILKFRFGFPTSRCAGGQSGLAKIWHYGSHSELAGCLQFFLYLLQKFGIYSAPIYSPSCSLKDPSCNVFPPFSSLSYAVSQKIVNIPIGLITDLIPPGLSASCEKGRLTVDWTLVHM